MGFLSGKRILVTGLASKLSIAYGIAQAMHREGAERPRGRICSSAGFQHRTAV